MRALCLSILLAGCGGAGPEGSALTGGAADADVDGAPVTGGDGGAAGSTDGSAAGNTDGSAAGNTDGGPADGAVTNGADGGGGSCGMTVAGGASDRLKLEQSLIDSTDATQLASVGDQTFWSNLAWDAARGQLIVFGGQTHNALPVPTLKWDGSAFSVVATADKSPPARSEFAMVYDSGRGRIVLFGGATGSAVLGDLWEWDGTRWNAVPFTHGPSARARHAMAYDSARKRVVLFGGADQNADLADTWEWDGASWTQTPAASGGPPAREFAGMAFDPATARTVLVGGQSWSFGAATRPLDGTTWEWDGTSWTKAGTSIARGGAHVVLVNEPLLGGLVMYGGTVWGEYTDSAGIEEPRPDAEASDFWLWKNRAWTQLFNRAGTGPDVSAYIYFPNNTDSSELGPDRYHWGAAWDDCRQKLVLFRHWWDLGELRTFEVGDHWSPDSAPVFVQAPGPQQVYPNNHLSVFLSASDPDADPLTWSTGTLPSGASFSAIGGPRLDWTPTASQLGDYSVDFLVSDGTDTTKWTVPIHVGDITYAGFASGSFSQTGSASLTIGEEVGVFDDAGEFAFWADGPLRNATASCTLSGTNPGVLTLACSLSIARPPQPSEQASVSSLVPQAETMVQDVLGPDMTGLWQVTLQPQADGSTNVQLTQGLDTLVRTPGDDLQWVNGAVTIPLK